MSRMRKSLTKGTPVAPSAASFAAPVACWNRRAWTQRLRTDAREYSVTASRTCPIDLPLRWNGVGDLALLYSEDLSYAKRVRAAGAVCKTKVIRGMPHAADHDLAERLLPTEAFRHRCIAAPHSDIGGPALDGPLAPARQPEGGTS